MLNVRLQVLLVFRHLTRWLFSFLKETYTAHMHIVAVSCFTLKNKASWAVVENQE